MQRIIAPLWVAAGLAVAVHAQEAPVADAGQQAPAGGVQDPPAGAESLVPKEPLIPSLGVRAEFSVRYFHEFAADWEKSPKWRVPARANAQQVELVTISTDTNAQTTRVLTKWSDGKVNTEWYYKGAHVAPRSNDSGYYVMGIGQNGPGAGFSELAWVNMKNFKGVAKLGETPVFVFRQVLGAEAKKPKNQETEPAEGSEEIEGFSVEKEEAIAYKTNTKVAYLDVKTQMPILSNDGQVIRVYSVAPTPTVPLAPPPAMIEMLKRRQAGIEDRVKLPGNPAG
jgi:hypothetical protein